MSKETITQIVCYEVNSGDGSGSYDAALVYDDWEEAVKDIKAALDRGRQILIERTVMTQAEYDDTGLDQSSIEETVRRFRGEN